MSPHPSELALEQLLLDPRHAPAAAHVDGCPDCQARLESMRREGDYFHATVYPATVNAVRAAVPRSRRWLPLLLPLAAAAAAALVVMVRPEAPDDGYVGTKGAELVLSVFVSSAGEPAHAVADAAPVPASSALRFKVRTSTPCSLWLLSIDARGEVSRLYPASGEAAPARDAAALPGGAVLDGRPGPERIFAVCSSAPLPFDAVAAAARGALGGGGEAGVRGLSHLPGLPGRAAQATLLLEKKP
jgi:hypothetical protein